MGYTRPGIPVKSLQVAAEHFCTFEVFLPGTTMTRCTPMGMSGAKSKEESPDAM